MRSTVKRLAAPVCGVVLLAVATPSAAQEVGVTHPPSKSAPVVVGWRQDGEGGDTTVWPHRGNLPALATPNGGRVCVRIAELNTLLYSYSLTTEAAAQDVPAGFADYLSHLAEALPGIASTRAAEAAKMSAQGNIHAYWSNVIGGSQPRDTGYRHQAFLLADTLPVLAARLLAQSDARSGEFRSGSFQEVLDAARSLVEQMKDADERAERLWNARDKQSDELPLGTESTREADALRQLQLVGHASMTAFAEKVEQAAKAASDPLCATVRDKPTRVHLVIKPLRDSVMRVTGDSVISFTAEPIDQSHASLGVGTFFVPWASGQRRFTTTDSGVVVEGGDASLNAHTAMFLQVRSPGWPLWLAIGASATKDPSLFFGSVWRPSDVLGLKLNASLGAGLVRAGVVTRVRAGQLNQKLPAGSTLDDVVGKTKQWGFGFTFTVMGLDLGKK